MTTIKTELAEAIEGHFVARLVPVKKQSLTPTVREWVMLVCTGLFTWAMFF